MYAGLFYQRFRLELQVDRKLRHPFELGWITEIHPAYPYRILFL